MNNNNYTYINTNTNKFKKLKLLIIILLIIFILYFHNKTTFINNILTCDNLTNFDNLTNGNKENSILPMFFLNNLKKYRKIIFFFTYVSLFLISKLLLYLNPSLLNYFLIAEKYLKYVGLIWILG